MQRPLQALMLFHSSLHVIVNKSSQKAKLNYIHYDRSYSFVTNSPCSKLFLNEWSFLGYMTNIDLPKEITETMNRLQEKVSHSDQH